MSNGSVQTDAPVYKGIFLAHPIFIATGILEVELIKPFGLAAAIAVQALVIAVVLVVLGKHSFGVTVSRALKITAFANALLMLACTGLSFKII